jgi:hypothetical protein
MQMIGQSWLVLGTIPRELDEAAIIDGAYSARPRCCPPNVQCIIALQVHSGSGQLPTVRAWPGINLTGDTPAQMRLAFTVDTTARKALETRCFDR